MDTSKLTTAIPRFLIRIYQKVSQGTPRRCRFYPTCSEYALQALEAKGLWNGLWRAARRIIKCHPWHPGGYDPVSVTPAEAGPPHDRRAGSPGVWRPGVHHDRFRLRQTAGRTAGCVAVSPE